MKLTNNKCVFIDWLFELTTELCIYGMLHKAFGVSWYGFFWVLWKLATEGIVRAASCLCDGCFSGFSWQVWRVWLLLMNLFETAKSKQNAEVKGIVIFAFVRAAIKQRFIEQHRHFHCWLFWLSEMLESSCPKTGRERAIFSAGGFIRLKGISREPSD